MSELTPQTSGMQEAPEYIFPPHAETGLIPAELMMQKSGLEVLQEMVEGKLPPPTMARTLNFSIAEAEKGRTVFIGGTRDAFFNPMGTIHGGWAASILDSAMGCAVHSMLEAGKGYTTVEFKINFIRPLFAYSGRVTCESSVIHCGKSIATSEATLKNEAGKLVAHANCTCAIFSINKK